MCRPSRLVLLLVFALVALAAACSDNEKGITRQQAEERATQTGATVGEPPPNAAPSPTVVAVAGAEPVRDPTYFVNTQPVGCHAEPRADAAIAVQLTPGGVLVVDASVQQPDGLWHREAVRQCWLRTRPGPLRLFSTAEAAEAFARSVRAGVAPPRGGPGGASGQPPAPTPERVPPASLTTCPETHPVKGSRTAAGTLVFHVPGAQFYERTRPEACFSSPAAAERDGYRRSD